MPNHLVLVQSDEDGLRRTLGDVHRRYTGYINARMRTTGHFNINPQEKVTFLGNSTR